MNGIWRHSDLLPPTEDKFKMTLGEGNTPLIKSRQLGPSLGLENLYFKLEATNPSGSYKDRFAASVVSNIISKGIGFCLATSSGNTGSALAAYCASAGIKCFLAIVDGAPSGKIQQMQLYGAETLTVRDFGLNEQVTSSVFNGLKSLAEAHGTSVKISAYRYSPLGMSGVQTIAYEIAESLPNSTNTEAHIFSPAGGGGLTLALAKGFKIWKEYNSDYKMPRVHCVQPEGNDTMATPLRKKLAKAQSIAQSTTSISGLQVPNVIDGDEVVTHCRDLGGSGYLVSDETVYEFQEKLAKQEGIFCEPAGAVSMAGVATALGKMEINKKDIVVCIISGHGFKDPSSVERIVQNANNQCLNNTEDAVQYIESQMSNLKGKTQDI